MATDSATQLPHNTEAERTALGAALVDNTTFHDLAEMLRADDFYREAHRRIFEAMASLYEKSEPIDLVTLKAELGRTQTLDAAGGIAYVAGLVEGIPRLENVAQWCRLIAEASTLRRLAHAGSRIHTMAVERDGETSEILDSAEQAIFTIADRTFRGGLESVPSLIRGEFDRLEQEARSTEPAGISSGFFYLDRILGGLVAPDLIILAARPGMGKTSLALQIARAASAAGPVAFFSMEMGKSQILRRFMFTEAHVDSRKARTAELEERDWHRLTESWTVFSRLPLFLDDTSAVTPLEMRAKCRRLRARHGLALIVVDYLQLMTAGARVDGREQEISYISRSLKGLAKDLNVPVLALSQMNRAVEGRSDRQPQLSDLRESGAIEQDADSVMFIHRPEVVKPDDPNVRGLARLIIEKQRNGPLGVVDLAFVREYTRFENIAPPMQAVSDGEENDD